MALVLVERRFRLLTAAPEDDGAARPLADYLGESALVVLGDPGAGKTTVFQQAALLEPNADFVSVRDFLALSPSRWQGKTLYLDALDEQRATSEDGRSVLDQIRGRLDELGRPRFRLSCRAADWYGSADAERLAQVSPSGHVTVLVVETLSRNNILAIAVDAVPDPEAFLHEAEERDLDELLTNPQTLLMLLAVVGEGSWPATRSELFRRSCEILARESNPEHARGDQPLVSLARLLAAAGQLFAIHLCAGTQGIALSDVSRANGFPSVQSFPGDQEALAAAARRRLFRSVGPELVVPTHRTVAEYLAARYLASLVGDELPLGRVLALLCGADGGTLSELRGTYAWLAALSPQHVDRLVLTDPLGVVLYGDVAQLSLSARRRLLESLGGLEKKNPWFRSENWASRPFGALLSPDIEPALRPLLQDPSTPATLVSCVLDSLRFGQPLAQFGDLLLGIVRDPNRPDFLRADALLAFRNACPDREADLITLLDDVHAARLLDEQREIRGILLGILYPKTITPAQVAGYLVPDHPSFVGEYDRFLERTLPAATSVSDLPTLLDSMARVGRPSPRRGRHTWEHVVGTILRKTLSSHGETVATATLYAWLGLAVDTYGHTVLESEDAGEVKGWLDARPAVIRDLFRYWLTIAPFQNPYYEVFLFWRQLHHPLIPERFSQWLLELAASEQDSTKADFLFREGIRYAVQLGRPDVPSIDDLFTFVESHARFRDLLPGELRCDIPDWKFSQAMERARHLRRQESIRRRRVRNLVPHLAGIRNGSAEGALAFLGQLWFGLFIDVERDVEPRKRLLAETNDEIADAASQGFIALLTRPSRLTPQLIGEASAGSRGYQLGYAYLAGLDALWEQDRSAVDGLPIETLQTGLAFRYANVTGPQDRPWFDHILRTRPDLAAAALESFWHPLFRHRSQSIPGVYDLTTDSMRPVAERLSVRLLSLYPTCSPDQLSRLMAAAVVTSNRVAVTELARRTLGSPAVRAHHRLLWLALAFALAPEEFRAPLARYVRKDPGRVTSLLDFLHPFPGRSELTALLGPRSIEHLIAIVGPRASPAHRRTVAPVSESMHTLINRLASDPSDKAFAALDRLRSNRSLSAWRDAVANAVAVQTRIRRETRFHYPSVEQVVATLRSGPPANAADLQALVLDHLQTLGAELRHGATDGYKTFWNVDSRGRPQDPRPEEECRNRLLDLLRPRLRPSGTQAEPEGRYAEGTRADVKILYEGMSLPIEIKRHYHRHLWTASKAQLQDLYTRDPNTKGRGLYLVLWFGERAGRIPKPPKGTPIPRSSVDLEAALRSLVPEADRVLLEVLVLDCSTPRARWR
jgi:hypothetical protein